MSDLDARITAVNPVGVTDLGEDDLPSFDVVWLEAQRAPLAAHSSPQARFVQTTLRKTRARIALVSTTGTGAAVAAAIVLSAGTTPTSAQAFPILNKRGTDISSVASVRHALASWLPSTTALFEALQSAHSFPIPVGAGDTGVGYLVQSPDGSSLCLVLRELGAAGEPGSIVNAAFGPVVCTSTADAEQTGVVAVGAAAPYQTDGNVFVALIPTGGTAELSVNGTTTSVFINDGIATGVAPPTATLAINVGGVTQVTSLAASTEPWWLPTPKSGGASSTSGPGSTGTSGATAASGTTLSGGTQGAT
jgi:hypothetical protein